MKILHLSSHYYPSVGGIETYIEQVSKELSKGHEVVIFTQNSHNLAKSEVVNGVRIRRFFFPLRVRRNFLIPQLLPAMMSEKFDIVHLHLHFLWAELMSIPFKKLRKSALICTVHNFFSKANMLRAFEMSISCKVLSCSDLVITTTDEYRDRLSKYVKTPILTLPYFVDSNNFQPAYNKRFERYQPYLFTATSLERYHFYKGIDILLRAFAKLRKNHPRVNLLIAGEGRLRSSYQKLSKILGIDDSVYFLGHVNHDSLACLYLMAEGFVLPSLHTESFGIVLLESLCCGTPVITSELPGVREINPNKELLCKPADIDSLADCMDRLLTEAKWKKEAMANIGAVSKRYSREAHLERLQEIYRSLVTV